MGTPLTPEGARLLAVAYASRGLGRVAPNPLVGAVLVDREHRFLAAGAHEQVGSHHAEINAFRDFDAASTRHPELGLAGGTLYVTLEPCAHAAKTPPCAPRVATSGVAKVVFGTLDPNPAVNGRGAAILAARGIEVEHDLSWQAECERLAEIFLWNIRHRTPFVALKVATSLDGYMARTGDRRVWLTGERARAYGHFLRTYYDAIVVGQGTLQADDPTLDTRLALAPGRTPWRVVLDPNGAAWRSRGDWRIAQSEPERVLWVVGTDADTSGQTTLVERGVTLVRLALDDQGLCRPIDLLGELGRRGITSLLVEGGAGLYASFLSSGLVNKLHLFQAPKLLGGSGALAWAGAAAPLATVAAAAVEIAPLGHDWVIETTLNPPTPSTPDMQATRGDPA